MKFCMDSLYHLYLAQGLVTPLLSLLLTSPVASHPACPLSLCHLHHLSLCILVCLLGLFALTFFVCISWPYGMCIWQFFFLRILVYDLFIFFCVSFFVALRNPMFTFSAPFCSLVRPSSVTSASFFSLVYLHYIPMLFHFQSSFNHHIHLFLSSTGSSHVSYSPG